MKVACVYIDHFAVAVEQKEDSSLIDRPLVIGGHPHERKPIYDFSPLAAEWGVKEGMSLRQAHELCPVAIFLPVDGTKYRQAYSEILDVLESFSPYVEDDSLGLAYLEISGMEGLHGDDETLAHKLVKAVQACFGIAPQVGVAGNKFTAKMGILCSSPEEPAVVAKGGEAEFLAPLPVSILPCSDKMRLRLHRFGVATVGHFASLPTNEVVFQFDENNGEGRLAHQLARGIDGRQVIPRQHPPTIVERVEYDYLVDSLEQIVCSIEQPINRAIGQLERSYRLCREIRLHLTFDDGSAWYGKSGLLEPTAKQQDILDAIKRLVEGAATSTAFPSSLTLILASLCGEKGRQLSLGTDVRRLQSLNRVVGELQRKLGQDCLKRPVITDPLARLPERRFAYQAVSTL